MNSNIKIQILKFNCNYSNTCNIKFGIQIKENNKEEYIESKHSFKIEKNQQINLINDNLYLNINQNELNQNSLFEIILLVYSKEGYEIAGKGFLKFNDIINNNNVFVDIENCSLGKGNLELKFFFNFKENDLEQKDYLSSNKLFSNQNPEDNDCKENIILENKKLKEEYNSLLTKIQDLEKKNSNINQNQKSINKEKEKIIEQLKEKIKYYEEELEELKGIIEDIKKENKEILDEKNEKIRNQREEIKKLKDLNDILNIENENIKNSLEMNKTTNNNISEEIEKKNEEIIKLKNENSNLNISNIHNKNELELKEEKIIETEKKIKELENKYKTQLLNLSNEYTSKNDKIILDYENNIRNKEEEIIKLKLNLKEKEENIENLNEEIQKLKSSKSKEQTETLNNLMTQIKSKDDKIDELKQKLQEEKEKNENNQIFNLNQEVNLKNEKKLKEEIRNLKKIINDLKERENISNKKNLEEFKQKENELKKSVNDNTTENEHFLNQLEEMQNSFLERENKLLKEKEEEIEKIKKEYEEKIKYKDNNTNYLLEIQRLNQEKDSIEEDLNYYKELNAKFVDNEKRKIELEKENSKLKQLITEKTNELIKKDNILKDEKIKMEEDYKLLQQELIITKEKLTAVINELTQLEMQNYQNEIKTKTTNKKNNKK